MFKVLRRRNMAEYQANKANTYNDYALAVHIIVYEY